MQPLNPVTFHPDVPKISYIEQTLLPEKYEINDAVSVKDLADAILRLGIRGAPALGCAGACGVALSALLTEEESLGKFLNTVRKDADFLRSTRPTAVNLSYGIEQVMTAIKSSVNIRNARMAAVEKAQAVIEEDKRTCHAIGREGQQIIPENAGILTHCNAGALACAEWGTALGVIRSAHEAGKKIKVYSCETRPLMQGSRLTTWELMRDGIDVTLITDSMAASLMRKGCIDLVVVGADRIVSNAVFNKIGTYMHAICAKAHGIPFYVAAPFSTFDVEAEEKDIIIEERSEDEVRKVRNCFTAPRDAKVWNPAFDATPMPYITGIITEYGIYKIPEDLQVIKEKMSFISSLSFNGGRI